MYNHKIKILMARSTKLILENMNISLRERDANVVSIKSGFGIILNQISISRSQTFLWRLQRSRETSESWSQGVTRTLRCLTAQGAGMVNRAKGKLVAVNTHFCATNWPNRLFYFLYIAGFNPTFLLIIGETNLLPITIGTAF